MSLLVVGSVAFDSVKTAAGARTNSLGGSALYFSASASYFTEVSLVAVVGEDFSEVNRKTLSAREIDISGLETAKGKTFRWEGIYDTQNLNSRETVDTQLNVFADFSPSIGKNNISHPLLFLANIDPVLQSQVLKQMNPKPKIVALDTMDYWINDHRDNLQNTIENVDVLFMDETEIKSFTSKSTIFAAAQTVREMGPRIVLVKRGEYGVLMFNEGDIFSVPAFPVQDVIDPTGAGDSFAGGFMGYLSSTNDFSPESMRRATVVASVMGSFAVEGFSTERVGELTKLEIEDRFRGISGMTYFEPLENSEKLFIHTKTGEKIGN
jgi:sugar/nucleoside kinase (ribokinase family)